MIKLKFSQKPSFNKILRVYSIVLIALFISVNSFSQNTFPSSGNVGVGTASPSVPFEIGNTLSQSATIFRFSNPQQNNQILFKDRDFASFLYGIESNQLKIGVPGFDHKIMDVQANSNNITFWPTFSVNSSSNIIINPTGNVGINQASPAFKLDVNGSVNASQYYINGSPVTGFTNLWLASPSNTNNIYYNGGNVGIGTNNPTVPFQIGTTLTQGATVFNFGNPQQYNQIIFRDRDISNFLYGVQSNQLKIGAIGSDHKIMDAQANSQNIELWPTVAINSPSNILINAGQNVGIGNANPQYKLDVSGSVNATQYLVNGNPLATLSQSGNNFYLPVNSSLGIGTNSPQYNLDVVGSARVSGNLLVGGGVITSQTVNAGAKINAGDVDATGNLNVTGISTFNGNTNFNGNFTANQGLYLGNGFALNTFASPTQNVGKIFNIASGLSGPGGNNNSPDPSPCVIGTTPGWVSAGNLGFYSYAGTSPNQTWLTSLCDQTNGNGYIDASGSFGNGASELFLNGKCNNNTRINWNGGGVYMGQYVFMKNNLEIGDPTNGIVTGVGAQLNMKNGEGFKVNLIGNTPPSAVDAFKVSKNGNDYFNVNGEGQAVINSLNANALIVKNTGNNTNGLLVKSNGQVFIGSLTQTTGFYTNALLTINGTTVAKELIITQQNWADYVFGANYKLPSLKEVESFYKTNKHLQDLPSEKDVMENGVSIGEMNKLLLQKIEELTIYLVDQNKKIDSQEVDIKNLKELILKKKD